MPNLKNSPLVQVGTIKRRQLTRQLIKRMEVKINDYRRIKLSFEMIFGSILRIKDAKICFEGSLASVGIFHAFVVAEEELAVEELDAYHSEDEVEEDVDDEDVEDVLQGVDDTVKNGLQLRNPLDGLERSEDTKNPQRLHHSKVFGSRASPESKCMSTREPSLPTDNLRRVHHEVGDDEDYYNSDDDDDDDDDDSSRHIHDKGGEGTGDDDQVHAIPHLAHVRARVQDQAIV